MIQGWKHKFFSSGGKEILIKSVAQAILSYALSVYRLSKGFCDDVARIFTRFLWGSTDDQKKVRWMSWDRLCHPKELGGLNFRDLEGFNKAFLAKQAWRLLINSSLLVAKVLKAVYYRSHPS